MAVTVFEPGNHQVWHQDPRGDLRVAYFDLELPITPERVAKMFRQTVENWARMMEAEGWVPTTKPIPCPNYYTIMDDPDAENFRRFFLAARFKRERPEYVPLDLISELSAMGPVDVDAQFKEFFEQMAGFRADRVDPATVSAQARENAGLNKRYRRK